MSYPPNKPIPYTANPVTPGYAPTDHSCSWLFSDLESIIGIGVQKTWTTIGSKIATVTAKNIVTGALAQATKTTQIDQFNWTILTALPGPIKNPLSATLNDGTVLCIGGINTVTGLPLTTVYRLNLNGTWTSLAPLDVALSSIRMTNGINCPVLNDGRVFVCGVLGDGTGSDTHGSNAMTIRIYDPASNTWSSFPSAFSFAIGVNPPGVKPTRLMPGANGGVAPSLFPIDTQCIKMIDGDIMIGGGNYYQLAYCVYMVTENMFYGLPNPITSTVLTYNPATGTYGVYRYDYTGNYEKSKFINLPNGCCAFIAPNSEQVATSWVSSFPGNWTNWTSNKLFAFYTDYWDFGPTGHKYGIASNLVAPYFTGITYVDPNSVTGTPRNISIYVSVITGNNGLVYLFGVRSGAYGQSAVMIYNPSTGSKTEFDGPINFQYVTNIVQHGHLIHIIGTFEFTTVGSIIFDTNTNTFYSVYPFTQQGVYSLGGYRVEMGIGLLNGRPVLFGNPIKGSAPWTDVEIFNGYVS